MALSILDGNQSATTLSTILSSGQHITAHTVVSLGTQAITDIVNATSTGLTNTQLRASAVTVGGTVTVGNSVTISSLPAISGTVTANPTGTQTIAGTVTANVFGTNGSGAIIPLQMAYNDEFFSDGRRLAVSIVNTEGQEYTTPLPISGTVEVANTVNMTGSVDANVGEAVFINTDDDSITSNKSIKVGWTDSGNDIFHTTSELYPFPVSLLNSVTASISNTVVTIYSAQGTTVTNSNFTSTTASTTLVSAVAGRDVLTVFNEGAGNLHISPGATCTTVAYQVRLSAGDYWECPEGQRSLIHTAVFATAGTARVTEVS